MIDVYSLDLLMSFISNLASTVFWVKDPAHKKQLYVSPSYQDIYGASKDTLYQCPQLWASNIILDEKTAIITKIRNRNKTIFNQPKIITKPIFYRVAKTSTEIKYIKNTSFPICDQMNNILAIAGFSESINQDLWQRFKDNQITEESNFAIISDISNLLLKDLKQERYPSENKATGLSVSFDFSKLPVNFTLREQQCFEVLLKGKSAKETARALNISPRTVETYLETIKRKLGCRTKIEMLAKLQELI